MIEFEQDLFTPLLEEINFTAEEAKKRNEGL
jgi:hypothetical protein